MLSTSLTKSLLRTTDNYIASLEKGGIKTVGNMVMHFPREHEDRTEVLNTFSLINIKEKNTILVKLIGIDSKRTANNKLLTKAVFEDINGFLAEGVFFNRKFLATSLKKYIGKKIIVTGKVKYAYGKVTFQSPEIETDTSKLGGEIVPIYPDMNYIPGHWIGNKIKLLEKYFSEIEENLPQEILKKYGFMERKFALHALHFPKNMEELERAKERLAYEELFFINYKSIAAKHKNHRESDGKAVMISMDADLIKDIFTKLPFELTNNQKVVLFQVLKDMEKGHAMQRLLEGDVGTGKTVVALVAAIHAVLRAPHPRPSGHPLSFGGEGERKVSTRQDCLKSPGYIFELAKKFRKEPTPIEEKVWKKIKNNGILNLKFRRQHPLGRYIADFYCEEYNLILEIDGSIHENPYQKEYDEEREKILSVYGYTILRIKNSDIFDKDEQELKRLIKEKISPLLRRRGAGGEGKKVLQVAFMAPTEILARQHFEGMQELLFQYKISSQLLVGSTTKKQKEAIKSDLKSGNIDIIVGTHALLQEDVFFKNLGFIVIDEQHRFGVRQREVLEGGLGNLSGVIPHNLNMTATPIPRTLALTLYGDQDLSVISEYPKGRKEIFTKVFNDGHRQEAELFIRTQLESGRQVFWISPLVEESEKMDLANAIATHENLQQIFHPFRVGLLHGKMKAKEKDEIMKQFQNNEIQILSSTSVVEVGVDIPNASIMCIEGAERFGLSQLHQFRGRVGRGKHQSYCYLFPTKGNKTDRLKAMEQTNNGFELSEIDLEIRGPGEVYGVRQSGVPDLRLADLRDLEMISQIRDDIEEMFEKKK